MDNDRLTTGKSTFFWVKAIWQVLVVANFYTLHWPTLGARVCANVRRKTLPRKLQTILAATKTQTPLRCSTGALKHHDKGWVYQGRGGLVTVTSTLRP